MGVRIEVLREVELGSLKIEISIVETGGFKVDLMAKDIDDR